jgi:tripartite-type tricarboxylate transporter receptor subunit TctC
MNAPRNILAAALAATALAAGSGFSPQALAQAGFPNKPLKVVVPFPAGGTTDIIARLVAQRMAESLGQPVVVENRGGAGGSIGADVIAKSAPDGYTLLIHNITFPMASVALAQAKRSPYNVDTDFAGVSIAANVPLVMTVNPTAMPARDLKEFVSLVQKNPGTNYTYGSTGPGSFMNVMGEALQRDANVKLTHVPFKGAAPMKQELLAGRVHMGGDQLSSSLADIKSGKLRALATFSARRIAELPDVPTVREQGLPILEAEGWNGFFVQSKTPRELIDRLHKEIVAAVRHPETSKRLTEIGAEPLASSPAEQDAILRKQIEQFRPVIQSMKLE